jgi:hypothetical protein
MFAGLLIDKAKDGVVDNAVSYRAQSFFGIEFLLCNTVRQKKRNHAEKGCRNEAVYCLSTGFRNVS